MSSTRYRLMVALCGGMLLSGGEVAALDESHPLPHYWINSSHNTYLIGGQLTGLSNATTCVYKMFYDTAGGGCVEIDPIGVANAKDGQEDIFVGHLMTLINKVKLSKILSATTEWAGKHKDALPLILSWDNKPLDTLLEHRTFWDTLDRTLYTDSNGRKCYQGGACSWYLDPNNLTHGSGDCATCGGLHEIPLSALRGKILNKWDQCYAVKGINKACSGKGITPPPWESEAYKAINKDGVYTGKRRWVHFVKSERPLDTELQPDDVVGEIISREDGQIKGWSSSRINMNIVKNMQRNFIRVYPPFNLKASESPNYSQIAYWLQGAQLVALNVQKQDHHVEINRAVFRDGPYRLKPAWMLPGGPAYPTLHRLAIELSPVDNVKLQKMKIGDPSGVEPAKVAAQKGVYRVTFEDVNVSLPIVYVAATVDAKNKYTGAVEIPWGKDALTGEVKLTLNKWAREGADYIPSKECAYVSKGTMKVVLHYTWTDTFKQAVTKR